MAISGDIVHHEGRDLVVVDVTGDEFAVLRAKDDLELLSPVVVEADELEVTGHVQFVDGWVELAPGVWEQT